MICSQYYNLYPSIAVISPATKNIEYIGGYKEYIDGTLFTFTFDRTSCDGFRVIGNPGGYQKLTSCGELECYR